MKQKVLNALNEAIMSKLQRKMAIKTFIAVIKILMKYEVGNSLSEFSGENFPVNNVLRRRL